LRQRPAAAGASPRAQAGSAGPVAMPAGALPAGGLPSGAPRKGNRGLWMALGAVACVCVLAAGAFTLPRFFKSAAATKKPEAMQTTPAQTTPVQTTPVQTTPAQTDPALSAQTPPATTPAREIAGPQSAITQPDTKSNTPVRKNVPALPHVGPAGTPLTPGDAPPQPTYVQPQTQPVAPAGPSQQDLDAADESLMKLRSRSEAVQSSLENLRSQQAAQGLSPRQDIVSSASRMNNYLGAAERALQAHNLESAHKNMEQAEAEIDKLEKFFGR